VLDSGAVFPDWGYGMEILGHGEIYRTYSRVAHDYTSPSFRAQYLQYLIERMVPPYSDEDLKTITFLFGLVGHQEADYTWHDNFVPVASLEDGAGENLIEIGCDLFSNMEYGEQGDGVAWFYPVQLLLDTYQTVGYDVPQDKFIQGLVILSVGVEVDKALSSDLWAFLFRLRLPWTHENFVTYPNGGLIDGGNKMADAWQLAWDEFEAGQPPGGGLRYAGRHDTGSVAAFYMRLAHRLLAEGAVSVDWRFDPDAGHLYIDRIEITDPARLEEAGRNLLTSLLAR
jgi:hypothetical protein